MNTTKLLLDFSNLNGVSGDESAATGYAEKILRTFGKVFYTPLGSLICEICPPKKDGKSILLAAHVDEVGLIVTYIEKSGFLRVGNCGGIDRKLLLASHVKIHTGNGIVDGVVCTLPPHINKDDSKNPMVDDIYIDIGYDQEKAKSIVSLGDRVTFYSSAHEMMNGLVCGKAIDDRAGCVAIMLAGESLAGKDLDCGVYVVLTTMEEVGAMGAKTAAQMLNPTHAIVVDVSFGYMRGSDKHKCGELHKGPMIGVAPVLNHEMVQGLMETARTELIDYQIEVMNGKTGTDADVIVTTGCGVKTALLSIPQKYMHTPIEMIAVSDVEGVAKLITAYIERGIK